MIRTFIFLTALLLSSCSSPPHDDPLDRDQGEPDPLHIADNVPGDTLFTSLLTKDVTAYFKARYPDATEVTWRLLRNEPTQSGLLSPKYYAWIEVRHGGSLIGKGAARLSVIEREGFVVTHYVDAREIASGRTSVEGIFPAPMCDSIGAAL